MVQPRVRIRLRIHAKIAAVFARTNQCQCQLLLSDVAIHERPLGHLSLGSKFPSFAYSGDVLAAKGSLRQDDKRGDKFAGELREGLAASIPSRAAAKLLVKLTQFLGKARE